jgi:Cyanobacterial and plant NDH-1 subunit O
MAIKKGDLVRAIRAQLESNASTQSSAQSSAQSSDSRFPTYLFETAGEVLDLRGDYAFVKFGQVPTPNIWLKVDQIEAFS